MSRPGRSTIGWRGLKTLAFAVYVFMFAPIVVVVLLAFNSGAQQQFPDGRRELIWFGEAVFSNTSIVDAFQTSLILAASSSVIATVISVMAAIAECVTVSAAKAGSQRPF